MPGLTEQLAKLQGDIKVLEARRVSEQARLDALSAAVREAELLGQDVERLKAEKQDLGADKDRLAVEVDGLRRRVDSLKAAIASAESAEQAASRLKAAYEALIKVMTELGNRGGNPAPAGTPSGSGGSE
jgi:septal ring factor EnvC (AmiA/AmiB activator)